VSISSPEPRKITEHFLYEDIKCPCCDRLKIIPRMYKHMELLEELREALGFPIIINSGYRCPRHNEEVNGTKNSQHMTFATDVRPKWGKGFKAKLIAMEKIAKNLGFRGIGTYSYFIHLDLREEKAFWVG